MLGIGWGWDRWARALFAAAVCAPAFAAFVLYAAIFGRLFPLVEYRSWLDNRGLSLWDVIYSAFGWSETYYRTVPHYLISVMARFCDAPICGNLILLFVMCAGLALMAFAIGVLAEWRGPGSIAAAATFAAFSEPWLENAAWQATVLDKFAGFFTAAVTLLFAFVLRTSFARRVLLMNSVGFGLILLAYNSKEAAWPLVPSLLFLGFMWESHLGWLQAIGRAVAAFALPIGYAAYVLIRFIAQRLLHSTAAEHDFGGSGLTNAWNFSRFILNTDTRMATSAMLLLMGLLAALTLIAGHVDRERRIILLWGLASLCIALGVPLFTQYGSAFYLYVPTLYVMVVLYVMFAAIPRMRTIAAGATAASLAAVLSVAHLIGFAFKLDIYAPVMRQSENFVASLPSLAKAAASSPGQRIVIIYPAENYRGYMFVDEGHLGGYVFPSDAVAASDFERRYRGFERFRSSPTEISKDGSVRAIYDDKMALTAIEAH